MKDSLESIITLLNFIKGMALYEHTIHKPDCLFLIRALSTYANNRNVDASLNKINK